MGRLFVQNLTTLDFAYLHPQRGLLGESWRVHVELGGALDEQGMVLDFGDVKRDVKRLLDQHFDHRLLVPARSPALQWRPEADTWLRFETTEGSVIEHRAPGQAVALIDAPCIDEAAVTAAALNVLRPQLPDNVTHLDLKLEPESIDGAFFHYAHGLKHHAGNCQRIAHGHRSRIEILRDGQRDPTLEADWARRWADIYIASEEDIVQRDATITTMAYESDQGAFELVLPSIHTYPVASDTTIENLAQHVAETLAQQHGSGIVSRVFEGVDKGAVGQA